MNSTPATRPYIGGQAVIEGVFMRAPRAVAIAVRTPDGQIRVKADSYFPFFQRFRVFRLPFLRGAFVMLDSLVLGMRALSWSAEQAAAEEPAHEGEQPPTPASSDPPAQTVIVSQDEPSTLKAGDKLALTGTLVLSMLLGLGLFVALPHLLTDGLGWATSTPLAIESVGFHLVDGAVKLSIFLLYLGLIRRQREIKRVFQYHGAEHKTIYAWESGLELTLDNVRRQSRFHPRCGTAFIIVVVCFSILVFAAFFPLLPPIPVENRLLRNLVQVAIKVPLTLPIAAVSYEFLRFTSRHYTVAVCRWMASPGLLLQRLTTEEPDDQQLQVAITALQQAFALQSSIGAADLGFEGEAFRTGAVIGAPSR